LVAAPNAGADGRGFSSEKALHLPDCTIGESEYGGYMFKFLILLAMVLGGAGYWYWTTTPEFAVLQVKEAIHDHDLKKFSRYVDSEAVASNLVDDLLTKPMQQSFGSGVIGNVIANGIVSFFKQNLVKSMEEQIRSFVETGNSGAAVSANAPDSSVINNQDISLGKIDSRLGFRKHAYKGIAYDNKNGKIATIGVKFHNELYDKDLVLDLKMRDEGGYWEVI
jgi:hypothetical protein